nr:alpha/beta hydrolase [Clostridium sp.]
MRDRRTSLVGHILREMMDNITDTSLGEPIQTGKYRKHPVEPPWKCPKGYEYNKIEINNFVMEDLFPQEGLNGKAILQLHGGGYIGPMKNVYRRFALKYCDYAKGAEVLTIDYRVAPEFPFPAALDDAIAAYEWLLKEKKYDSNNIIIAGDSAGGGLALALGLYLKDNNMPYPAAFITMSPWTDLTNSGTSYKDNFEIDPLFGKSTNSMLYNSSYIGDNDPKNYYISPMFGDFEGFPPMLMQVGTHEVLLSDTLTVAEKAKKSNVDVKVTVYEGMFHVFQMVGDLIPEGKAAWDEVEEFINRIWD